MGLRVTMLGSGTSTGVPVIGCECAVCTSADPRNHRLRPGAWLELPGGSLLLDTPIDLRLQALRHRIPRVDAVLFTHAHVDHTFGLDELRIYNFRQRAPIPCYGSPETLARVRETFAYAFAAGQEGGGRPRLELIEVRAPFTVLGVEVQPIPVWHGETEVLGYRLGAFAYVTDVNRIPESSFALLTGVEVLVLGALRWRPHPTHFSIGEALVAARRIGARRTLLTHLTHDVDATALREPLPDGVELGHDGLVLELD